jgi:hypothetical protein
MRGESDATASEEAGADAQPYQTDIRRPRAVQTVHGSRDRAPCWNVFGTVVRDSNPPLRLSRHAEWHIPPYVSRDGRDSLRRGPGRIVRPSGVKEARVEPWSPPEGRAVGRGRAGRC